MVDKTLRFVALPKGGTLELEASPAFYDAIRKHFCLASEEIVSDDHIRMFIWGATKSAIDEAERKFVTSNEGT